MTRFNVDRTITRQATSTTAALVLALTLLVGGCGGGGGDLDTRTDPVAPQGLLVQAGSAAAYSQSLQAAYTEDRPAAADVASVLTGTTAGAPNAPPAFSTADTASFTTTYTQDAGVDEPDVLKYDGDHLFIAPRRFCCSQLSAPTLNATDDTAEPPQPAIRILSTDTTTASAREVARIELPQDITVQGLHRSGNSLAAITATNYYGGYGDFWLAVQPWSNLTTGVRLYDTEPLSDGGVPTLQWQAELDGGFIDSRRIGDALIVVQRFTPEVAGLNPYPATDAQRADNAALLAATDLDDLLPKMRLGDAERPLVDPASCFVRNPDATTTVNSLEQPAQPVLTLITRIDLSDPAATSTLCYAEDTYGVYVSPTAIYLTRLLYDNDTSTTSPTFITRQTEIHKFDLNEMTYSGSGTVDGALWTQGQFDFRIHEHADTLRLLTTDWDGQTGEPEHRLFVLRESSDEKALVQLAQLPNSAAPEPIGKPNEALYGVRFFNDRAYAVTFERIDPLYVIDLSEPAAPFIAGELEIPGVSDFLHPVNRDLLLGLGFTADWRVKLELFDVSDATTPSSIATTLLGGTGSYSEAIYNRHAFTYLATAAADAVDRFAIPASLTSLDDSGQWQESGLYLFEISGKQQPRNAALNAVGALVVEERSDTLQWPTQWLQRSVIDANAVYFLYGDDIFSAPWNDPTSLLGPQ